MDSITKNDLEIFAKKVISEFEKILDAKITTEGTPSFDWLRSKEVRKLMNISPATLQNLRITGKIRFNKIMGSYYYNNVDLKKLFENDQ